MGRATAFARTVRDRAGLKCEVFPSGERSKCLKWPGQVHPETGQPEVFVPPTALRDTERLDTSLTLQALRDGFLRTPAKAIHLLPPANREADAPRASPEPSRAQGPAAHGAAAEDPRPRRARKVSLLACDERLVRELFRIAGRDQVPLGRKFRCFLPGHRERRPSATFCRGEGGAIFYHDWHASKYGTPEWLTLGEVRHALEVGCVEELEPVYKARALAVLGLQAGIELPLTVVVRDRLEHATRVLQGAGVIPPEHSLQLEGPTWHTSLTSCFHGDLGAVERVWEVLCREALISAQGGFEEIKASVRFLAAQADLPLRPVSQAVNLLCVLGVLSKVSGSGGMRGDRFVLAECDASKVERRWEALGKQSLRDLSRGLVERRLGPEIAGGVFRRQSVGDPAVEQVGGARR